MSKISRTLVAALALSFAAVPAIVAGETDGSECIDVSAAESSCSPEKYQGRLDDMAKHPENFSPDNPNFVARLGDRGRYRMIAGQWEAGVTDLDVVIADDPDNYYFYQWRGWAHLVLGNLQRAHADFTQVIRLHQTNAIGYLGRCRVRQARADWNAALTDCQRSLKISNASARPTESRFVMGEIFQAKGLTELAKHSYERALEADPGNDRAKAALAALEAAEVGS